MNLIETDDKFQDHSVAYAYKLESKIWWNHSKFGKRKQINLWNFMNQGMALNTNSFICCFCAFFNISSYWAKLVFDWLIQQLDIEFNLVSPWAIPSNQTNVSFPGCDISLELKNNNTDGQIGYAIKIQGQKDRDKDRQGLS